MTGRKKHFPMVQRQILFFYWQRVLDRPCRWISIFLLAIAVNPPFNTYAQISAEGSTIPLSTLVNGLTGNVNLPNGLKVSVPSIAVSGPQNLANVTSISEGSVTISDASGPIEVTSSQSPSGTNTNIGQDGIGTLTISGSAAIFTETDTLFVGREAGVLSGLSPAGTPYGTVLDPSEGNGTVIIGGGARFSTNNVTLGYKAGSGYRGTYRASATDPFFTAWTPTDECDSYTGIDCIAIPVQLRSEGTIDINGGEWNSTGQIIVGDEGDGHVDMLASVSDWTSQGPTWLASQSESTGTIDIQNGSWENFGEVRVGRGGRGEINISGGSANIVLHDDVSLGDFSGSEGTINITGGSWEQSGSLSILGNGQGIVNASGGSVDIDGRLRIIRTSSVPQGIVNVDGGVWTVAQNIEVRGDDAVLNVRGNSTEFNSSGSTIELGWFTPGDAQINVESGATFNVSNGNVKIGLEGGDGTLSILSGGSMSVDGFIEVGVQSEETEFCDEFGCFPAPRFPGQGHLVVDGAGSTLDVNSGIDINEDIFGATNTLSVNNGGNILSNQRMRTATNTILEISGTSSRIVILEQLIAAGGQVDISAGGRLDSRAVVDSQGQNQSNTVRGVLTIDGADSKWIARAADLSLTSPDLVPVIEVGTTGLTPSDKIILTNNGTIEIVPSVGLGLETPVVQINQTGVLEGSGNVIGDVFVNGGTVAPGSSPGVLSILGDLHMDGGVLEIEIGGSNPDEFDVIDISGFANLTNGTLLVSLIEDFIPVADDEFKFLSAGLGLTDFDLSIQLLGLPDGIDLQIQQDLSGLTLMAQVNVPLPAPVWLFGSALGILGLVRAKQLSRPLA